MTGPRLLTAADIPQVMLLSHAAAWNQTREDWLRAIELERDGCFGIDRDGRLVATATTTCYGADLAWIGMVLTAPEYRSQGLARQLMQRALEFLDGRQIRQVKLDATAMGSPLYRKLGFVDERPMERWRREPAVGSSPRELPPYEFDAALDRRAFGADRRRLLALLGAGEATSIPGFGYAMGRAGSKTTYFGPCVAIDPETAKTLAEWFVARHANEPIFWDLIPENRDAVRLAQSLGFARNRELARMVRPGTGNSGPLSESIGQIYAIAGFEFG